jgi:hypothetical protein
VNARYISVHNISSSSFQLKKWSLTYTSYTTHHFSHFVTIWAWSLSQRNLTNWRCLKVGCQRKNLHQGKIDIKKMKETTWEISSLLLSPSPKIIRVIKSRTVHFESSVAHVGRMGNAQKISVTRFYGKTERRDLGMGGKILKWILNIYVGCGSISRIAAARNWVQCSDLLNKAMNLRILERSLHFLFSWVTKSLLKKPLHYIIGYNDVHACMHARTHRWSFPKDNELIFYFGKSN